MRIASDVSEASLIMAQALGETAGAQAVGIFLLDYQKESLLLLASWSALFGLVSQAKQQVPLHVVASRDPLCHVVISGEVFISSMVPVLPASISLFYGENPGRQCIAALPFWGHQGAVVGGAVLCFETKQKAFSDSCMSLCDFFGLCVDTINLATNNRNMGINPKPSSLVTESPENEAQFMISELFVGISDAACRIRDFIAAVANETAPVLICGKTGVGKKLIASTLHVVGPRRAAPFRIINCRALGVQELDRQIFGFKKDAFHGASQDYPGLVLDAEPGTLVLENVEAAGSDTQEKMHHFIQTRETHQMGSLTNKDVSTRIIATSGLEYSELANLPGFHNSFLVRLGRFSIQIPPLREHLDDLPLLIEHFLDKFRASYNYPISLTPESLVGLVDRPYPGNVTELEGLLHRAVIMARSKDERVLYPHHFSVKPFSQSGLPSIIKSIEAAIIDEQLRNHHQNVSKAAKALGIPSSTLRSKLKIL